MGSWRCKCGFLNNGGAAGSDNPKCFQCKAPRYSPGPLQYLPSEAQILRDQEIIKAEQMDAYRSLFKPVKKYQEEQHQKAKDYYTLRKPDFYDEEPTKQDAYKMAYENLWGALSETRPRMREYQISEPLLPSWIDLHFKALMKNNEFKELSKEHGQCIYIHPHNGDQYIVKNEILTILTSKERRMFAQFRTTLMNLERIDQVDEMIALAAFGRSIEAEYAQLQSEAPDWLTEGLKSLRREIRIRLQDTIAKRLSEAKSRLASLATPEEKRSKLTEEIAKLEALQKGE